jgi:hypothetical protein
MIFEMGSGTLSSRSTTLQRSTLKGEKKKKTELAREIIERHFELFA